MNLQDQIGGIIGGFIGSVLSSAAFQTGLRLAIWALILLWALGVLWTMRDAHSRTHNWLVILGAPLAVVFATPAAFPLAIVVWRIIRPARFIAESREEQLTIAALQASADRPACPACRGHVNPEWRRCPWCRTWLHAPCPRCERLVELSARACPWCSLDLAPGTLVPRVGAPAMVPVMATATGPGLDAARAPAMAALASLVAGPRPWAVDSATEESSSPPGRVDAEDRAVRGSAGPGPAARTQGAGRPGMGPEPGLPVMAGVAPTSAVGRADTAVAEAADTTEQPRAAAASRAQRARNGRASETATPVPATANPGNGHAAAVDGSKLGRAVPVVRPAAPEATPATPVGTAAPAPVAAPAPAPKDTRLWTSEADAPPQVEPVPIHVAWPWVKRGDDAATDGAAEERRRSTALW